MRKGLFFLIILVLVTLKNENSMAQGIYTPSGTGAWGNVIYSGGGFTLPAVNGRDHDAKAGIGIGLGNPVKSFGVQIQANLLSLQAMDRFSFGFKIHKYVADGISVATGVQNVFSGGTGAYDWSNGGKMGSTNSPADFYLAFSHNLAYNFVPESFLSNITYSIDLILGSASRISSIDVVEGRGINKKWGTFVAAAVKYKINQHFNFHTEWSGSNLNTAITANGKLGSFPFTVLLGAADLTRFTGDKPRLIASVGFAYKFPDYKKASQCSTEKLEELIQKNQSALNEQLQALQQNNNKLMDEHKDLGKKIDSLENKLKRVDDATKTMSQGFNNVGTANFNSEGGYPNMLFFDIGKSKLRAESISELDKLANLLKVANASNKLEIAGHADETGSVEANTRLSKDRAKAAADYLISKQIQTSRIDYKGYSNKKPIASNATEEGRQKNRRVEFKIVK